MAQHTEIWRPVVGHEAAYEVSDHGRIRSVERVTTGRWGSQRKPSRMLTPDAHVESGHMRVTLHAAGARRRAMVHRLVLEAFVGPCPDGMEGCHNDGNPANNALSNLRWDTHGNNIRDKRAHGTDHYASRDSCSRGHLYTPGSYRIWRDQRLCKECDRIRARQYKARRKASAT